MPVQPWSLHASFRGAVNLTQVAIANCLGLWWWPATSASHSLVYGNGISSCQAGVTCRFVVETRDRFDLPVTANDEVLVTIDGSQVCRRCAFVIPVRWRPNVTVACAQSVWDTQVGTIRHDADHYYVVEYSINGPGFRELAVKVGEQSIAGARGRFVTDASALDIVRCS